MGAQGTTTINFGSFPGAPDAVVAVTGQSGILSTSICEAWIFPVATSDHSVAEHYVAPPRIIAGEITAGTGFNIRGFADDSEGNVPLEYGAWTVAWCWN